MGESTGVTHRITLARAGLPVFATPDQAVRGFGHLARDRRNREAARELPPSRVLALAPEAGSGSARRSFNEQSARRRPARALLTQDEALDVLAAYGIPVAPTRSGADPGRCRGCRQPCSVTLPW